MSLLYCIPGYALPLWEDSASELCLCVRSVRGSLCLGYIVVYNIFIDICKSSAWCSSFIQPSLHSCVRLVLFSQGALVWEHLTRQQQWSIEGRHYDMFTVQHNTVLYWHFYSLMKRVQRRREELTVASIQLMLESKTKHSIGCIDILGSICLTLATMKSSRHQLYFPVQQLWCTAGCIAASCQLVTF